MMFDATQFSRQLGIERVALDAWIEAGWLRPARAQADWRFSMIDLVRAQFILDLRDPLGVNDEGVDVILDLLDQIHGLRRALLGVTSSKGEQKSSPGAGQPADAGLSGREGPSHRAQRPARRGHAST